MMFRRNAEGGSGRSRTDPTEFGVLDALLTNVIVRTLEDLGWAHGPGIRAVMRRNVQGPRFTLATRGGRALDREMDVLMRRMSAETGSGAPTGRARGATASQTKQWGSQSGAPRYGGAGTRSKALQTVKQERARELKNWPAPGTPSAPEYITDSDRGAPLRGNDDLYGAPQAEAVQFADGWAATGRARNADGELARPGLRSRDSSEEREAGDGAAMDAVTGRPARKRGRGNKNG